MKFIVVYITLFIFFILFVVLLLLGFSNKFTSTITVTKDAYKAFCEDFFSDLTIAVKEVDGPNFEFVTMDDVFSDPNPGRFEDALIRPTLTIDGVTFSYLITFTDLLLTYNTCSALPQIPEKELLVVPDFVKKAQLQTSGWFFLALFGIVLFFILYKAKQKANGNNNRASGKHYTFRLPSSDDLTFTPPSANSDTWLR